MKHTKRIIAFLAALFLFALNSICVFAEEPPQLVITADSDSVTRGKTLTLTVDTDNPVRWTSSDSAVATVDASGTVTGIKVGTVKITAADTVTEESASIVLNVTGFRFPWRNLLEKRQILGYRYNYKGNYYYTDDRDCWQEFFGFNFAYDVLAPIALCNYDYVRVFFTYESKDWMIQMWKGQYGLFFYGGEVGVYTKPEGSKSATRYAHYSAAKPEDYLKIGTTVYHQSLSGESELCFERPYDEYWWCTGFVPGHLRRTIPCNELRAVTRVTLKDEKMTELFAEGLIECGFEKAASKDAIQNDTFFMDGSDVYLQWQDISGAANYVTQASIGLVQFNGFLLIAFFGLVMLFMLGLGGFSLLFLI